MTTPEQALLLNWMQTNRPRPLHSHMLFAAGDVSSAEDLSPLYELFYLVCHALTYLKSLCRMKKPHALGTPMGSPVKGMTY